MNYPNSQPALPGDIINTYGIPLTLKNLVSHPNDYFFKVMLYRAQRREFKHTKRRSSLMATHSRCFIDDDRGALSVTRPRAEYDPLYRVKSLLSPDSGPVTVWRYEYADQWSAEDIVALTACADGLVDTEYDEGQLVDDALKTLFPWIPKHSRIFDGGKENVVCSVGARLCLNAAVESSWEHGTNLPYAIGTENAIATTSPARFENSPRMKLVYECRN